MSSTLLVLRLSALGDVIHAMPAVLALHHAEPSLPIGWAVESPYARLVETVAPVQKVFPLATRRWRGALLRSATRREVMGVRRDLHAFARGGIAVDFQGLVKSAVIGVLGGAERRVGFDAAAIRERAALLFYGERVSVDRARHVVEWNMQLARAVLPIDMTVEQPDYSPFAEDPGGEIERLMERASIVLSPATGQERKNWGGLRFAELARELQRRGSPVMVVWGPGEETLARAIAADSGALLAPPTTLPQLAFLLARSRAVVAGDTGPLHLAAAFGVPVVGLYGPTDPRRNGPWGQVAQCVETFSTTRSMADIPVRSVLERLEEVVG